MIGFLCAEGVSYDLISAAHFGLIGWGDSRPTMWREREGAATAGDQAVLGAAAPWPEFTGTHSGPWFSAGKALGEREEGTASTMLVSHKGEEG
jgi:hypothetical protein